MYIYIYNLLESLLILYILIRLGPGGKQYSAFANSCPLQTDTFLFPLIHSHNVLPSSNKFY